VITDLGDGVFRVTHGLPWALNHVHCYVVSGADGWTLVDAGLNRPETLAVWREALATFGNPRVERLVVTHYHPDHIGASAALAELTGAAEVVQGAEDARQARDAWDGPDEGGRFRAFLLEHGMPEELVGVSVDDEENLDVVRAEATRLVDEGDTVEIGDEVFDVLVLRGHADGHIALLGRRTGRLFAGDVLLERITPNVGLWPDGRVDPLSDYLETLARIEELQPAVVYPGHEAVVLDPAARARAIREHHWVRLDEHAHALGRGARSPWEVAVHVWGEGLGFHEQRFALAEALAHLTRLAGLGRAQQVDAGLWALA
jgi:glyoxylase-like metal-dependent hydrolase (beta-lactamase superfamily II)